jgi:hypothetical protein
MANAGAREACGEQRRLPQPRSVYPERGLFSVTIQSSPKPRAEPLLNGTFAHVIVTFLRNSFVERVKAYAFSKTTRFTSGVRDNNSKKLQLL